MPDKHLFSRLLREYRQAAGRTRKSLADSVSISVSYLSFLENGEDKRLPKRHVVNELADFFKLSFAERNELLLAAGHRAVAAQAAPDMLKEITRILSEEGLDNKETDLLVRELKAHALRWKRQRKARQKDVRKAVIVAAGWQSRLLAPEKLEATILQAALEAIEASIDSIVVVLAPTKSAPRFDGLHELARQRKTELAIDVVTQEEPLGLGHAILSARAAVGEEPFAVILPVDVDPSRTATREMRIAYREVQRPMLAVNPKRAVPKAELQHYGVVELGERLPGARQVHYVKALQEKPRATSPQYARARVIMGRYILTPDIFDVLQSIPRNTVTRRIEITDALVELIRNQQVVCAYNLNRPLLSMAPVRALMELLLESIGQPHRLAHMIRITQKAIEDGLRIE